MLFDGTVSYGFFEDFCMFFWEIFWSGDIDGDAIDMAGLFINVVYCADFESFCWKTVVL